MEKELLTVEKVKTDLGNALKKYLFFFGFAILFLGGVAYSSYAEVGMNSTTIAIFCLLLVLTIYGVYYILKIRKKAEGDFLIVSDVLSKKCIYYLGRSENIIDTYHLKFSECGKYEIPNYSYRWKKKVSAEKLFSTCTEGDEFWLVTDNGKKGEILAVYNKKYFELSGELKRHLNIKIVN